MDETRKPLVIGIGGRSGSGKTWVANQLKRQGDERVVVLNLDRYYFGCTPEQLYSYSFDMPSAVALDLAEDHLKMLCDGDTIKVPIYDFETHSRVADASDTLTPAPVIVVEGLFTLHHSGIRDLCDLLVYVKEDGNVCLRRRLQRDVNERGRDMKDVFSGLEDTNVGFERYVRPSEMHAHFSAKSEHALTMINYFLDAKRSAS